MARKPTPYPVARLAGILSNDARFKAFIAKAHDFPGDDPAVFIRGWCDVASRRDLDTDPAALARFRTLQTEFDAWSGRIPSPR